MSILVTGGSGFIGSHTCVELLENGYQVVVVDNLSNSSKESLNRVKQITGTDVTFYEVDLCDKEKLIEVFKQEKIEAVIHFAGLKAVGESVEIPLKYYHNNITGTLNLLEVMNSFSIKNIVFSSSATVYGNPKTVPIKENFSTSATNPYGRTKLMLEEILKDLYGSDSNWNIALLRYFNPVGAHPSGLIGEDPNGIPNNLLPFISKVAIGELNELKVFGSDYDTPDGTGVRDYIHVVDLAKGHICALKKLEKNVGIVIYNLGTGKGFSVLDMINAFSKVSHKEIPYKMVERRKGDIASCFADATKAKNELGWIAQKDINTMCIDAWNWQTKNPNGYRK